MIWHKIQSLPPAGARTSAGRLGAEEKIRKGKADENDYAWSNADQECLPQGGSEPPAASASSLNKAVSEASGPLST